MDRLLFLRRSKDYYTFVADSNKVKYKNLFFDLDHTLWDYHSNSRKSLGQLYHSYHLEQYFESLEEFITRFNFHNDLLWEDYRQGKIKKEELRHKRFGDTFIEMGLKNKELEIEIGDTYLQITPKMNILFPNTIDTLIYLKEKGYALYILTNGFLRTQELKMENAAINTFFVRIFSSEELGVNKPAKEFFHWVVSSLHAKKSDCLMIGDDEKVDVGGAVNYGIDAIWFNSASPEVSAKAVSTISDLSELKDML